MLAPLMPGTIVTSPVGAPSSDCTTEPYASVSAAVARYSAAIGPVSRYAPAAGKQQIAAPLWKLVTRRPVIPALASSLVGRPNTAGPPMPLYFALIAP